MVVRRIKRPVVGIVPGDPNGIGPEVVVKAWASGRLKTHCSPVVVGSPSVIEKALDEVGAFLSINVVKSTRQLSRDEQTIDVLDVQPYKASASDCGCDTIEAGAATGAWLDHADRLAREGVFDATVMGPISSKAMELANTLSSVAVFKAEPAYLVLRSGRLVIAHLTDHTPLRDVSSAITRDSVYGLIEKFSNALREWGVGNGKTAVAGFNPHASGIEESNEIKPAVDLARARGLDIEGPISPDTVFRQVIEGRYDAVIAMYHDQGHIALKTWGFSGNSVVFLGPPYVHTTVAHGVAFDIAGSGKADGTMMLNAILDAAHLAQGKGFFSPT